MELDDRTQWTLEVFGVIARERPELGLDGAQKLAEKLGEYFAGNPQPPWALHGQSGMYAPGLCPGPNKKTEAELIHCPPGAIGQD